MLMQAGPIEGIIEFFASNPIFTGLLVAMLAFVFFMYLLVRRTVLGLREGFDQGRER